MNLQISILKMYVSSSLLILKWQSSVLGFTENFILHHFKGPFGAKTKEFHLPCKGIPYSKQ